MELREFVKQTLLQVVQGVSDAQEGLSPTARAKNARITPEGFRSARQLVEFDVVVSTTDAESEKAGAGIFVGPFALGAKGEDARATSNVSRIKFQVPVALPTTPTT